MLKSFDISCDVLIFAQKRKHMLRIENIFFHLYRKVGNTFTELRTDIHGAELRDYLLRTDFCHALDLSPLDDFIRKVDESDSKKNIDCHILYHNGKIHVAPNISYLNSMEMKLNSMDNEVLGIKYVIKDVVEYSLSYNNFVVSYRVSHDKNKGRYMIYVYDNKVVVKYKSKDEVRDIFNFGTKPFFVVESRSSRMGSAG